MQKRHSYPQKFVSLTKKEKEAKRKKTYSNNDNDYYILGFAIKVENR